MRADKFLKVSRLIKRRAVAKDACLQGRITINGKTAKAGSEVSVGDVIVIQFGSGPLSAKVLTLSESVRKDDAAAMYEILGPIQT